MSTPISAITSSIVVRFTPGIASSRSSRAPSSNGRSCSAIRQLISSTWRSSSSRCLNTGILEREYAAAGRGGLFERLKVVLTDGPRAVPHATLAAQLGTTEVAAEAAVRRLRGRYRDLLRAEIAATPDDPLDLDDEIRDLFAALRP
jgi:hypothetical protein